MNKSVSPNSTKANSIEFNYAKKKREESLKWIFVNIVLFLLFVYDLWAAGACPRSVLQCVQALGACALGANVAVHARRVLGATPARPRAAPPAPGAPPAPRADPAAPVGSPRVWRTADSSPPPSPPSPARPDRLDHSDEFISDRRSLDNYLRQQERRARECGGGAGGAWAPAGAPHYQLAPLDSEGSAREEGAAQAAGVWRRLLLDPRRVSHWNQNLRLWLQLTVLQRLDREMARVDEALAAAGAEPLGDAPLERLRRTPAAAALLPYLERFADQRHAVRRVRELARGGCLSAYRWDEGEPPDAELLLQLLAAYLDAQLPPAPAARAFSSAHLSSAPAPPPRGPHALVIHRVSARPPHYVLVCGDEVLEVPRGRNNLLHTVLLLLAAAAQHEPPALQRLHLGPAGLNLLWVIGR